MPILLKPPKYIRIIIRVKAIIVAKNTIITLQNNPVPYLGKLSSCVAIHTFL